MDFGDILTQWETDRQSEGAACDEGRSSYEQQQGSRPTAKQLKKMRPQRTLDLHGCTVAEAQELVPDFLRAASKDRLSKVLIIHGKGYHSKEGRAVLPEAVHACLDRSPHAGARGVPERALGGTGAVWVAVK
jgi:DNA-nicking Smr family endonuclease